MKWTCVSTAPAVRIFPLPAMISVSGPMTRSGWTPSMVSGFPALPMPVIRPSRMPTSALTMPQWSMIKAPVTTVSGAPSARVVRDWPMDSRITLPPPNTASSPARPGPAASGPPRSRRAGRCRRAGRGRRVVGPNRSAYTARSRSVIEGTSGLAAQPRHDAPSGQRDEFDVDGDAGLEAHGGAGGDVQSLAPGNRTVEVEAGVGLGEVVVGADLHGPVGGVDARSAARLSRPSLRATGSSAKRISPGITVASPVRRSGRGR